MAGDSRRGRRDNGLDAAAFVPLLDVDPRVGEHLLDVLGSAGVPAYLEPSADVEPYTRALSLPSPPTDRLWVDRDQRRQARMIVDAETPHGPRPVPSRDDEPSHGLSDAEEERAWQEIIAGFDAPPAPPATGPGGGRTLGPPPYRRDDDPEPPRPDGPSWFGEPPTDGPDGPDDADGPADRPAADRAPDAGAQNPSDQDWTHPDQGARDWHDRDRPDDDRDPPQGDQTRGDRDPGDRDDRDQQDRHRDDHDLGDADASERDWRAWGEQVRGEQVRGDQARGERARGDRGWSDGDLARPGERDPFERDPLDPRSWLEPGARSDPLADRPSAYRDRDDLIVDPWSDLDTGRRGRRRTRGGPADADPLPSGRDLDRAAEDRARREAARDEADDVWIDGPPTLDGDEEHFEPPPPPPYPRPSRNTVLAILLLLLGVMLMAVPQVIGMDDRTGLTLGVLSVLAGGVLLVLRLREARDEDGPDDGAVV